MNSQRRITWRVFWVVICVLCSAPPSVEAQRTRLVIRNGVVRVNGDVLPKEQWPVGLDVRDISVNISIADGGAGYFGQNGRLFVVTNQRFRPANDTELEKHHAGLERQSAKLQEQRVKLDERIAGIRQEIASVQGGDPASPFDFADWQEASMQEWQEAMAVWQAAFQEAQQRYSAMVERYFQDVQAGNRELYERLIEESDAEQETVQLAFEIRSLQEGDERNTRLQQLRALLEQSFRLIQENRRREVAQLEDELSALRLRMGQREQQRERIIEARLRQLLSESQ